MSNGHIDKVDIIPGFTAEQSWAMRVVAKEAAKEAIAEFSDGDCPVNCAKMESVQAVVFGRTERGIVGMDHRLADLERAMSNLRRITWIAVSALAASVIGWIFALIQSPLTGG